MTCFCEMCNDYFHYSEENIEKGYRIDGLDIGICAHCMDSCNNYDLLPIVEAIIKDIYIVDVSRKSYDTENNIL